MRMLLGIAFWSVFLLAALSSASVTTLSITRGSNLGCGLLQMRGAFLRVGFVLDDGIVAERAIDCII